MPQLLADDLARAIVKRERVLELFGKCAAADCRDIQQQAVLRIIKQQSLFQLTLLVNALTNYSRRQDRRRDVTWLITDHTSIRAGNHIFRSAGRSFRPNSKDTLRRQTLLDVEAGNYRSELILNGDLQQAVAGGGAPDLF